MTDMTPGEMRVVFPSQTRYVHMVTMVANNAAIMAGFNEVTAGNIAVATDEAVTNVIRHAYGGDPNQTVTLQVDFTDDALVLQVLHTGKPVKKEDIKLPNMDEYIKKRCVGGLGLFLITKFMDEVDYVVGDQSCYKMTKFLDEKSKKAAAEKGK